MSFDSFVATVSPAPCQRRASVSTFWGETTQLAAGWASVEHLARRLLLIGKRV